MSGQHLIYFSVPGLRVGDITQTDTPTLHAWATAGLLNELTPTFPCVTSTVQASMFTGTPPAKHGIIANGFFERTRREVEFWTGRNDKISGTQVWSELRNRGLTSAAWHAQNIKDADADFIVTPAPIHEPDGSMKLWCYSKPDDLYPQLLAKLGHFPLQHYWGPLANIESTKWILRAANLLHAMHAPNFHWIYLPHLDYAMQKFGPNAPQSRAALKELDDAIAQFLVELRVARPDVQPTFVVAGEYALTEVVAAIHPNRILREAGLLNVKREGDHELIEMQASPAFAMVDHQFAHIYIRSGSHQDAITQEIVAAFENVPGVHGVFTGNDRASIGLDHVRSGDIILISDESHWFSYYWWLDDRLAPPFARTVDIHQKPGYDPVELFFDPQTRGIPLDANLVRGSHGIPATNPQHRVALICSKPVPNRGSRPLRDTDLKAICLQLLD